MRFKKGPVAVLALALAGAGISSCVIKHRFNTAATPMQATADLTKGMRFSGPAHVHDGDTMRVTFNGLSHRVRLFGIDAPELDQTCKKDQQTILCGNLARDRLAALIGSRPVTCHVMARDRYRRVVATCFANGIDLARTLVNEGLVIDYTKYSKGLYAGDEAHARASGLGLWAMEMQQPARWRAQRQLKRSPVVKDP